MVQAHTGRWVYFSDIIVVVLLMEEVVVVCRWLSLEAGYYIR